MSEADLIAITVKSHLCHFTDTIGAAPTRIILGRQELAVIRNNAEPCNPPDLSPDGAEFCGIPLGESGNRSCAALVYDLVKVEP